MPSLIFILAAFGIIALSVIGIRKLRPTRGNRRVRIFLGIVIVLILIWLGWLTVMVFGVGPAFRNQ